MPRNMQSQSFQAEIGEDFDYYKVRTLRIQLMNEHIEAHGLEEKQGLGQLLDYLKEHHYLLAVATATDPERTKRYLGSLDRLKYFDQIVCASMVKNGKPAPDIYLEAAARLHVDPSACMALEDSPNGIMAAYQAGMYPVMVPDLSQPDEDTKAVVWLRRGFIQGDRFIRRNVAAVSGVLTRWYSWQSYCSTPALCYKMRR